jgi:prepilin-type N-terminal cleavage/methylation domain-containing protein
MMVVYARIRRRLAQQRGFTLIELLVSMTVGVVIIGVAYGLLDAVVRTYGNSGDRVEVSQRGRHAMDTVTQRLRSQVCGGTSPDFVPSFTSATKDRVVFWSDIGDKKADGITPQGKRLRGLEFSGGTLYELEFPGTGQDPTATPTKRAIATDIAQNNTGPGGTGIFRFYAYNVQAANRTLNPPADLYIELTGGPNLATSDLQRIVRVTVNFTAFPPRGAPTDKVAADFTGDFLSRTAASPYEFDDVPTDPTVVEPRCK